MLEGGGGGGVDEDVGQPLWQPSATSQIGTQPGSPLRVLL